MNTFHTNDLELKLTLTKIKQINVHVHVHGGGLYQVLHKLVLGMKNLWKHCHGYVAGFSLGFFQVVLRHLDCLVLGVRRLCQH